MKVKFNTIYHFNFQGRVKFGDLVDAELYELCQDGRFVSKLLEKHIPIWFPELKFVDQSGYDHVDVATESKKWDLKGFTKRGASYIPSNMLGAGRKIDINKVHEHANTINYIFSDVSEFPLVRIQFKAGPEMVGAFPNGKIAFKSKNALFNGINIVYGREQTEK